MSVKNMAQLIHVVPVLFEANKATGVVAKFINMKLYEKVEWIISFGTMGTADYTFKMQASAAVAGTTATDLAFNYRLTAAAGTDTMGDVTAIAAASTMTAAYATDSTMLFIVDLDSSELTDAKPYAGVYLTRGSSATAQIQIIALCWPKYPKETNSGALS